jgi:Uma2 family endonuclease
MGQTAAKRMTVDEFLAWCPADERRWELVDGRPTAMAPSTRAHGRLLSRLARFIDQVCDNLRPCASEVEAGIRIPDRDDAYYEADIAVSCTPPEPGERGMTDPVFIVEILSSSTMATDRRHKLPDYRSIPSVREILLVDQGALYAEVHRRLEGDRWLVDLVQGPEARLRLESIGLDVALADIYAGVPLDEAEGA